MINKKTGRIGPWIDRTIGILAPRTQIKRTMARAALRIIATSPLYSRATESTRLNADWTLPTDRETPEQWELEKLRDRTRDLVRWDPIAAGASDTMAVNIIGSGLRPQSRIRADRLDIDEETASVLRKQAEDAFSLWSGYADASNRLNFSEMQFIGLRKIIEDGETILNPTWATELWRPFGRIGEMIESDRLRTPVNIDKKRDIEQGIEFGERKQPIKYWIRKASAKDWATDRKEFIGIPARDKNGRPGIIHAFESKRPGQYRGISEFAPVINYFKDLADYLEAEIVAARVAACLAVFITKGDPLGAAIGAGTDTETETGARIQALEPGLINYLGLGEKIEVVDPKRGGEAFDSMVAALLRIIGISLGIPYELLVKDFSKSNYSSARAALLEGRRKFLKWRSWFAIKFCQPIWELVLEEAFLRGLFNIPDFWRFKHEVCRAQWIGGAWGWVDPVKEVEASKKAIDYGLSTLAEENAGQGRDWEETLEQKAREEKRIEELKLIIPSIAKTQGPGAGLENEAEV